MERYALGEVRAFEELYTRWEGPLFGFLLRMLSDQEAAADAFQEVWSRVIENRERYEPRGRFRSWLFTIARRASADRTRVEERERERAWKAHDAVSEGRAGGPAGSALENVIRTEEIERLLGALPRGQREAVLLSKHHGFSYAEIAEMTGGTEAAVKQKVYRALKALRKER